VSRSDVDGLFRRSMYDLGVPFVRRWMMWAAVRAASRWRGAGVGEFLVWLLVAIPVAVFVFIPALVIVVWLAMFWLIEWVFYAPLKLFGRRLRVHRPKLRIRLS
jgi:hypothetical protein